MIDKIRHNAELVQLVSRKQLGINVEFDRAGVEWLDGYITRQHQSGDPSNFAGRVNTLGSFLGECIKGTYGGEWAEDENGWGIQFDQSNKVFPFSKVEKHLENGPEDSVLSMFDVIPIVFKRLRS